MSKHPRAPISHELLKVLPVTVLARAAEKLREAILSGVFTPGERLIESELCQRMGISRTSVREALRRLEAERLVVMVPNRGPFVAEISWHEAQQIYYVRALLEGEAAALCAMQGLDWESRNALLEALQQFEAAVERGDALERVAAAGRFYHVILKGCGNSVIAEVLEGLVARISFLRARSMSRPGRANESAGEMRRICEAILAGDGGEARKQAAKHVQNACCAARMLYDGHHFARKRR